MLCIDSNGYTETYKRFYFRDIQAVIIRRTEEWKIVALALGCLAALMILFMALTSDPVGRTILGCIAGVFALGLIITVVPGPTATCHLKTAVQLELLGSANRVRRARRVLERLKPLIAEAQSNIPRPGSSPAPPPVVAPSSSAESTRLPDPTLAAPPDVDLNVPPKITQ